MNLITLRKENSKKQKNKLIISQAAMVTAVMLLPNVAFADDSNLSKTVNY
ncbi:MAG: hypothetical protein Q4B52_05060 [Tissierellia bacterium]|nr:hypothetical protein [Tissierellia bacterium]